MSQSEANVELVKSIYATFEKGPDWHAYSEYLAPDCQLHEAQSLPYGGVYVGREGVVAGTKIIFGAFDDFQFHIVNWLSGGDEVVVHLVLTGTGRKTGKTFSLPLMEMWRIRDGKVSEVRPFYFDSARVSEVFG